MGCPAIPTVFYWNAPRHPSTIDRKDGEYDGRPSGSTESALFESATHRARGIGGLGMRGVAVDRRLFTWQLHEHHRQLEGEGACRSQHGWSVAAGDHLQASSREQAETVDTLHA